MPDTHFPLGVVARLGTSDFRLPTRYATVFLMPPDCRTYIASDAGARVYREYDLGNGRAGRTILGPELYGPVSRPSADGTRIAVAATDGIRVVDLTDGRVVFALPPGPEVVRFALAPAGDRLAVVVRNPDTEQREADGDMEDVYVRSVVVHDIGPAPGCRELFPLVNYGVTALFSQDGCRVAVSGEWREEHDDQPPPFDGPPPVQVWDLTTGAEVARIRPPDEPISVYPAAAAGEWLLLCSANTALPVGLYDFATGQLIRAYRIDDPPGYQKGKYDLSPDGRVLAGHAWHGPVVRRDARTGAVIDITPCPFPTSDRSYTGDLAVLADGTVTALRVDNQAVQAWTAPEGRPLTRVVGGIAPITAIGFADHGREVRTAGRGEAVVRRWDARTGERLGETDLPEAVARCCLGRIWFGLADRLVAQSRYGSVAFHLATREARLTPAVYEEATLGESLSADGWRVSLPTHYRNETDVGVRVEHVIDGGAWEIYRFDSHSAAAAYDRGRVLLAHNDRPGARRTMVCLRVGPGRAEVIWSRTLPVGPEHRKSYRSGVDHARVNFSVADPAIVWASDGSTVLVIPGPERVPFLIDPASGETIAAWVTAVGWPHAAHPSRPVLATTTADGDGLILADWRTGVQIAVLMERCYPHALAWSPDGSRLVASGADGMAWVFDLEAIMTPTSTDLGTGPNAPSRFS
ncbi:hypothetical protein R5W23_000964 [Gemmata sp. JC673]|uniref:WD40 repeat domain-containing protein n=1 Tax=Gemmata algarum TaxID=2975278 RepID=A0ABU5EX18_9BACT|nr:hypothetical protein [Gemmata algarum]MDY3559794.1 hypothetical protein [Gemmata algarum]